MRKVSLILDYLPIDKLLEFIDEPHRTICRRILADNRRLFETAQGSTHNHQAWKGGYIDHIVDCMNYARHKYDFDAAFGRPLPYSKSDVLLIIYLHDLEKPWRIVVDAEGNASNREDISTKDDFERFRDAKLAAYGLVLTPRQRNAFKYVEGEYRDYSSKRRVMNELGEICHSVDTKSARGWYDYPKPEGQDEWIGADRFRTV